VHERVLFAAAEFRRFLGDSAQAEAFARQGLAEAQAREDDLTTGMALYHLANALADTGHIPEAARLLNDAIAVLGPIDHIDAQTRLMGAHASLAVWAMGDGDLDRADALAQEALIRAYTLGSHFPVALALNVSTEIAQRRGDRHQAVELVQQSLALYWENHNTFGVVDALRTFAGLLGTAPFECTFAARLLGVATALATESGDEWRRQGQRAENGASEKPMRVSLVPDGQVTANSGGSPPLAQVIREALAFTLGQDVDKRLTHDLTLRELDVVRLIARGQSNREIGDALFISPRTVASHIRNIFSKLNCDSRTDVAAWAFHNRLA
jgi:ATP/maltotriose-dependent transcriptional regulator MalT